MDVRLVVEKGRTKTRAVKLRATETIVGRRRDAGLRIPSAQVSRHHCRIVQADGYLLVEDLMSANGTFINGKQVKGLEVLRPGDHLKIGPVTFVVEYELTQAAIDRLRQRSAKKKQPVEEEFEVAEVVEDVPEEVVENVLAVDEVLPVAAMVEEEQIGPVEDDDFLIPVDDDPADLPVAEMAPDWQMPEADDLRDMLSQLGNQHPPK